MWDYDEEGSNILIDGVVDGQPRKVITHAARNGFLYSFERANGQTVMAKPYVAARQLDQGHRPEDREAGRLRSQPGHPGLFGPAEFHLGAADQNVCARRSGAATITSRRPTARRPGSSTSRPCRIAMN